MRSPVLPRVLVLCSLCLIALAGAGAAALPGLKVSEAVKRLSASDFPAVNSSSSLDDVDDAAGILLRPDPDCSSKNLTPASFELGHGRLFVSVRKPARAALFKVAAANLPNFALIAVASGGDALITSRDGVLRVVNLSGTGDRVKTKIEQTGSEAATGTVGGDCVFSLKPGYELVASDRALSAADLRPAFGHADNFARRRSVVLENDREAVCEISLISLLTTCPLLEELRTDSGDKRSRRVFADLIKEAALLNYQNGDSGFAAQTANQQ